jgi:predicted MPP superfamily phosphohydrolase
MMVTMWGKISAWGRKLLTSADPLFSRVRPLLSSRAARRLSVGIAITVVALVGAGLGVAVGARTDTDVGPFHGELIISPSVRGDTEVQVPPLGSLTVNSHDGPAHLTLRLGSLDVGRTRVLLNDPNGIVAASDSAVTDVEAGLTRLVLKATAVAVLGALALATLIFRNARRVAWAGGIALAVSIASFGIGLGTFRPQSIQEPKYQGLLVNAPAVVGDAQRIANRYDEYRLQLQRLIRNVSQLYSTVSALPVLQPDPSQIRVLHVSDLHLNPAAWSVIHTVVEQFNINMVVDTGDITDWGTQQESSFYVSSIASLNVPYVFIRGNHDSSIVASAVARQRNAVVLENKVMTVGGLTFAGIGDPRFTPDKDTSPAGSGTSQKVIEQVLETGSTLARTIRDSGQKVDVALVHDPASAGGLNGEVPLVLAGHIHHREVRELPPVGPQHTRLLIEGSTGGAGLRGLEDPNHPLPLALSVLYFDEKRTLQAYDDIQVGGTGLATVTLERHVTRPPTPAGTPSPTPSR